MKRAPLLALLALLASACGNSVDDVCGDLDAQCPGLIRSECLNDGAELQQSAEDHGCSTAFDTYLDCTARALCTWKVTCATQRAALEACVGTFPF